MTKQMSDVLEFLSAFIAGGANQDFKPWARELHAKLYGSSDEPPADTTAEVIELKAIVQCIRLSGEGERLYQNAIGLRDAIRDSVNRGAKP